MKKIGILYGGRSGEHEVSLCSAASVVSALDAEKYEAVAIGIDRAGRWHVQDKPEFITDPDFGKILKLDDTGDWRLNHFESGSKLILTELKSGKTVSVDAVFPAVHGTYCEDGTLQGLLELAMVPFVGADAAGSAVGMDKDIAKRLLAADGIPVVEWITIHRNEWPAAADDISGRAADFGYPLFVKPCRTGSSVGVVKVKSAADLSAAVETAFLYDSKIMIERGINAREIECAVLGNRSPRASVLGEIVPKHEFYSYEAKYIDPDGASLTIPALLDKSLSDEVRSAAVRGYESLCCSGMARVDFFLDRDTGKFYLNEINTLPGFTSISMFPKLMAATGISYPEVIDTLIDLAFERHNEKKAIKTER